MFDVCYKLCGGRVYKGIFKAKKSQLLGKLRDFGLKNDPKNTHFIAILIQNPCQMTGMTCHSMAPILYIIIILLGDYAKFSGAAKKI